MSGTNSGSEDVQVTTNVDGGTEIHDAIPVSETDVVGKSDTDDGVAGSEEKEKHDPERSADLTTELNEKTDIDSKKEAGKDVTVKSEDDFESEKEQLNYFNINTCKSLGSESDGKHQDRQKDETSDKTEETINEKLEGMHIADDQEKITEKGNVTADSEATVLPTNVDADSCADKTDASLDTMYTDSKPFKARGDIVLPDETPRPEISMNAYLADTYKMDYPNRGKALIINNKTFKALSERKGTDVDAKVLDARFTEMGFETETFLDQTKKEMLSCLKKASKQERYTFKSDCFVCAILSHGEKEGIYGVDGKLTDIHELLEPFKGNNCSGLVGKPKLFFVQACQGKKLDDGAPMDVTDSARMPEVGDTIKIPAEADFLIARSSVPEYYSWRNKENGSWFIQALSGVLRDHWKKMDLLSMMTRVNKKVAFEFESNHKEEGKSGKKQIPCTTSMLTKRVLFTEK